MDGKLSSDEQVLAAATKKAVQAAGGLEICERETGLNEFVATVNSRTAPAPTPRKAKTAARASQENPSMTILAGISALTIVGSTAHAAEIQTALVAAGAEDGLVVTAVEAAPVADASAEDERGRIMALVGLCPETTVSASLTTAIESGQAAGDFAIGLAQAAKGRGASMEQLRAGSVQPDQLPAGGKSDAKNGVKAPTGQARGAAIVARAAALGHKAVAHLAPAKG